MNDATRSHVASIILDCSAYPRQIVNNIQWPYLHTYISQASGHPVSESLMHAAVCSFQGASAVQNYIAK